MASWNNDTWNQVIIFSFCNKHFLNVCYEIEWEWFIVLITHYHITNYIKAPTKIILYRKIFLTARHLCLEVHLEIGYGNKEIQYIINSVNVHFFIYLLNASSKTKKYSRTSFYPQWLSEMLEKVTDKSSFWCHLIDVVFKKIFKINCKGQMK